jgi:hypothetical protein
MFLFSFERFSFLKSVSWFLNIVHFVLFSGDELDAVTIHFVHHCCQVRQ